MRILLHIRSGVGRLFLAVVFALVPYVSSAQQPHAAAQPAFEAASIRPSHLTPACFSMLPPGSTHYAVTCVTLRNLIAMAWKVNPDNIQGGDTRVLDTYYDLTATTPDGQPWSYDSIPPMMRQLLIERFHTVVHTGSKQASGYALTIAKGGPKLKTSETDFALSGQKAGASSPNYIMPGHIQGRGADLSLIASLLSSPAHATVVDRTGVKGVFDFDLHYAIENGGEQSWPELFIAVEEQLGLRLKSEKITIDTLVIDHTDSMPTSN